MSLSLNDNFELFVVIFFLKLCTTFWSEFMLILKIDLSWAVSSFSFLISSFASSTLSFHWCIIALCFVRIEFWCYEISRIRMSHMTLKLEYAQQNQHEQARWVLRDQVFNMIEQSKHIKQIHWECITQYIKHNFYQQKRNFFTLSHFF